MFGAQRWHAGLLRRMGQADAVQQAAGRVAQVARQFGLPPDGEGWPLAAWSRQAVCGDAADALWLRADPAWMAVDINGVRLLGVGERLHLEQAEADALAATLVPLFAESGLVFDWPQPSAAWLRLPPATRPEDLPRFADPDAALGDDVFEHTDTAATARPWRLLAGEVQMRLHQHPVNQARVARGLPPVNALWFWGAGKLPPTPPVSGYAAIHSEDSRVAALAQAEGVAQEWLPQFAVPTGGAALFDLSRLRDAKMLQQAWLLPALAALGRGQLASLVVDEAGGHVLHLRRWQRLRVWRKAWAWPPATSAAAGDAAEADA